MSGPLPIALYVLDFLGYGVFAAVLVVRNLRQPMSVLMALAATVTAVWAISELGSSHSLSPDWCARLVSALRDGAWFAVVLVMMDRTSRSLTTWRVLAAITTCMVLFHAALATSNITLGSMAGVRIDARLSGLLTTILGCILTENLARNSSRDQFWSRKFLIIGMVAILTFQFVIQLTAFLNQQSIPTLLIAGPFFYLVALPLFALTAIRTPTATRDVYASRTVIFHTASLVIAGIVFQGTAIAAYYLRSYGGGTGIALAIILAFAAFVGLLGIATSSTLRSRLRNLINENFYKYKYDYRAEWTKFIFALSAVEESGTSLKVLRTFADLMDSPGGALWLWKDSFRQFVPTAKWSVRANLKPIIRDDTILAQFENDACILIDLTSIDQPGDLSSWKEHFPGGWLIVPLRYRSRLMAIILLSRPRTPRTLDWEDRNLIALVAMQLAAYLVHDETNQALLDAKQMEEFNKRFAFVVHDMKNTIGQLELLARNSERFSEDPTFQKDMSITLRNSVEKLNALLVQLRPSEGLQESNSKRGRDEVVNVVELVKSFVVEKQGFGLPVSMNDAVSPAYATIADDKTLINVLEHVVANAIDVTPSNAKVELQLSAQRGAIRIAINDHGPGMSQEFINERLFRPFRTTKQRGFGIGAYQAREKVRNMGGTFEVFSAEGRGTSVVISLPCKFTEANRLTSNSVN
jgi:putative PEP-CTERM system histidine kinase